DGTHSTDSGESVSPSDSRSAGDAPSESDAALPLLAPPSGGDGVEQTALDWLKSWLPRSRNADSDSSEAASASEALNPQSGAPPVSMSSAALNVVRSQVTSALVAGIRLVSAERDRDEIIRWFVEAREILARNGSTAESAKALYSKIDTLRFGRLLTNTIGTSLANYRGANLPLSLKVALPVTAVGAAVFGAKYAGLAAFGSGLGLPVVLLLFLGTAGATSVVEAFVKDRGIRDPLTRLLLTFVAFETARRAKRELLDALRADAMTPLRAVVPPEAGAVLESLLQLDPVAFERHVMSFFEQAGHPTGLTARSNDFGVDGYVFHPDGLVIVQCKRYALDNPVGRPDVQQFKGVVEEQQAFRGYFVTTSRFTDGAVESAAKNERVRLIDGEELVRWHLDGRRAALCP
ncbi:MAG TPA: restriction endonuclease, partial [Pirellulales bacterium]